MQNRLASIALAAIALMLPASASAQRVAASGSWPVSAAHTLAIANDGTVWAWGSNTYGQLGDGTTTNRLVPVQVQGVTQAIGVAAGWSFSLALTADGTVWAWGRNQLRQLGDGTTDNRLTPVPVLANATKIAAGESHSLAVTSDGSLWTWGYNTYGQLGNGTTQTPTGPAPLNTISGVSAIAGAPRFSVAVKADGTVWAWGDNGSGQHGNGTTTSSLSPVQVSGITDATSVAVGFCYVLARRSNGAVSAWGCNWHGGVGDGSYVDRLTPITVSGLPSIAAVAAGFDHSLALTTTGEIWSWGRNAEGQLGDGTVLPCCRASKTVISGLSSVAGIGGGGYNSLAFTTTGVMLAWGDNQFGQIGDGTLVNRSVPTQISEANFAWKVGTPTFSPAGGTYSQSVSVTITTATAGATIHYSTDGSTPTESHPVVSGPVTVDQNMTLQARAWHPSFAVSNIASTVYTFNAVAPSFSPGGGTYSTAQTVSITTSTSGGVIRYTTDGTEPTEFSATYSAPLSISRPTTLKAKTFKTGWNASSTTSAGYSFSNYQPTPPVATPAAGTYNALPLSVTLSTDEPGGVMQYTTNGTEPTPGNSYTAPIPLDRTTTVKSRTGVFQPDWTWTWSLVRADIYVVKAATPVISLASGQYAPGTVIQVTSATPDAVIRYRLDGQTPSDTDPQLPAGGTLMVGDYTLSVRAFFQNMDPSDTATAAYTMSGGYSGGAIAAGGIHSVAVTANGEIWTWGDNRWRQLGYGEKWGTNIYTGQPEAKLILTEVLAPQVESVTGVKALSAGYDFTIALRNNGSVWTWGNNGSGQLGQSTCDVGYPSPSNCVRPTAVGLTNMVAVAAGGYHALALRADGTVWAWGGNTNGQLGDGTTTGRSTPVQVTGLTDIIGIAAGHAHSLALKSDGRVFGWGDNVSGQVGDGTAGGSNERHTPVPVVNLTNVRSISAGYAHSLAVDIEGKLWAWGANSDGQLGDGTTIYKTSPTQVLTNVYQASGGTGHTLAVKTDGTVWAWGANTDGQLGDGTTGQRLSPIQVSNLPRSVHVAAESHSLAIAANGSLWTWGNNSNGQVGDGTNIDRLTAAQVMPAGFAIPRKPIPRATTDKYGIVTSYFSGEPRVSRTAELGVGWVRLNFYWKELQPAPGPFQDDLWENLRSHVTQAQNQGLKVYATLVATPEWARIPNCPSTQQNVDDRDGCPPANYEDWQNFVAKAITEFDTGVTYGIWNEPNLEPFLRDDLNATVYKNLFDYANRARESINPSVTFAGPETSHHGYTDDSYNAAAISGISTWLRPTDIVSVHWYPDGPYIGEYLDAMKLYGGLRDVWLTETGALGEQACSEPAHATRLVYAMLEPTVASKIFWYQLHEPTDCSGIVNNDPPTYTRRGAFNWFRDIIFDSVRTGHIVNLQAALNHYVTAEGNGGAAVNANRTSAGEWETLTLWDRNGGDLNSGDLVSITTSDGWYFNVNGDALTADRWLLWGDAPTIFRIEKTTGSGVIGSGNQIRLRALTTDKYMSAVNGGGGGVDASMTSAGSNETFTVTLIP